MFREFTATNFRCFTDLHLKQLARVNLIAGKNNTGKTAALEAIHLHCHPFRPILWLKFSKIRGIDEPTRDLREVASWLFKNRDTSVTVDLSSCDSGATTRSTRLSLLEMADSKEKYPEVEEEIKRGFRTDIAGSDVPRLILKYSDSSGGENTSVSFPTSQGISSVERLAALIPSVMLTSLGSRSEEDIETFSALSVKKRQDEIVRVLHLLDERVRELSLLSLAGQPVIHADIGLPHLIPVPLLGEGVRRLLSILLAIAVCPRGVVLIDEIENGLHYSVLSRVWTAIGEAAQAADAQVFATTHSWECIRAAHEAFSEADADIFQLIRLDRTDAEISAVHYDREMVETALLSGLEMR